MTEVIPPLSNRRLIWRRVSDGLVPEIGGGLVVCKCISDTMTDMSISDHRQGRTIRFRIGTYEPGVTWHANDSLHPQTWHTGRVLGWAYINEPMGIT